MQMTLEMQQPYDLTDAVAAAYIKWALRSNADIQYVESLNVETILKMSNLCIHTTPPDIPSQGLGVPRWG
jgi:hypothetical protein